MGKHKILVFFAASSLLSGATFFLYYPFMFSKYHPNKTMKMSSTDTRLASPVSTFWCEALWLSSDHPFLAYQLSKKPSISPISLSRSEIDLNLKLDTDEMHKAHFYLLPGTVMTTVMCSIYPGATISVLRARDIVKQRQESAISDPDKNAEDFGEGYDDVADENCDKSTGTTIPVTSSSTLKSQEIPARNIGNVDCDFSPSSQLFQLNITSADTYFVAVRHDGPAFKNMIKIRLFLDRTSYDTNTGVRSVHICGGGLSASSCEVPLDFLSEDHVLIKIPGEPGAGLATFKVRTLCKPRDLLYTVTYLVLASTAAIFLVILALYMRQLKKESYDGGNQVKEDLSEISLAESPLLKSKADEGNDLMFTKDGMVLMPKEFCLELDGSAKQLRMYMEFYKNGVSGKSEEVTPIFSDVPPPSHISETDI